MIHIENPLEEDSESPSILEFWSLKMEYRPFDNARIGDHLLVSYECDLCVFCKLRNISADISSPVDRLLLVNKGEFGCFLVKRYFHG